MPSDAASPVIASRFFERADGKVGLHFYAPTPWPSPLDADPEDPPWRCRYRIDFPGDETKRDYAVGIDGVQALLLVFAGAMGNLRYVGDGTPAQRPALLWLGQDDLGLSIQHFREGDDAI